MRKKLFLVALLVLSVAGYVYAETLVTSATKARAAASDKGLEMVVGIGDVSSGNTQEIDSEGAAFVKEYPKEVASSTGGTLNTGTALVGSAARVYSIYCGGITTSAGDYALIYDAAAATGTPKFECNIGTAKDGKSISIPGGVQFDTSVFVDSNADTVFVSVTYDD